MTSPKDIELDDVARAMEAATPTPDADRKAEAIARSMEIFANAQGSQVSARQSSEAPKDRGFFKGALDMMMSKITGALSATTALVAVGFLFLSPQGQELLDSGQNLRSLEPLAQVGSTDMEITRAPEIAVETRVEPEGLVLGDLDEIPFEISGEADSGPVIHDIIDRALSGSPEAADDTPSQSYNGLVMDGYNPSNYSGDAAPSGNDLRTPAPIGGLAQSGAGNAATISTPAEERIQPARDSEEFANADDNPLRVVADDPVSTFSIDVDTAAYSLLRSSLNRGQLPTSDAVRIEEMVNYFPYDYPAPDADSVSPFQPTVQVFQTPWNPDTQLVHIGIQGEMPLVEDRPPLNLVFLIDTSGSMNDPSKLPLLIQSFRLMLDRLNPDDEVAIVTYAGHAGVALQPTSAADTGAISSALSALQAGGGTNGVGGLEEAYRLAAEMTQDGEVSRVLLATDGDFNVGLSDPGALEDYIAEQRETGIYLSVLGFGRGNLQDDTMQALAQNGNGTAAYIDTLHEAQRVLVDQMAGALFPIADDLKVQVEFNPAVIAEYRLIGYETRALAREDFANDAVDAGDIGAGHSVTAIYEVTPVGSPATLVAPLRYAADDGAEMEYGDELGFISLRWKEPGAEESQLIDFPIASAVANPGSDAQFATAIAGFGQLLRGNEYLGDWGYVEAIALANANRGVDEFGYRTEAVQLMRLAQSLAQ